MLRGIVSLILGGAVTYALFVFMAFLIGGGPTRNAGSTESPIIEITMSKEDASAQKKPRVKPKPPAPPEQPPKPDTTPPDSSSDIDTNMSFNMGGVEAGGANTGFKLGNMMTRDGDATPIVRIEPQYPIAAARDGKEGWVQLSFTINALGGVEDVKVIEAQPKRVFDKEARRALRRWKYKPKVVDGVPQRQPGLTVQLDFKMDGGD